jgi:hypothetical protein
MKSVRRLATLALLALVGARAAGAAPAALVPDDPRLGATRGELQTLVDEATRGGLPAGLLVDKVREGLAKGVAAPRILQVVRGLEGALATARAEAASVAKSPPPGLLKALVEAHAAGVPARDTDALLHAASARGPQAMERALVVVTDLAQRGFPVAAAARALGVIAARNPAALDKVPGQAEALAAHRGVTRAAALDALARASVGGMDLEHAGSLLDHRPGGPVEFDEEQRGPRRESSGPRSLDETTGRARGKP